MMPNNCSILFYFFFFLRKTRQFAMERCCLAEKSASHLADLSFWSVWTVEDECAEETDVFKVTVRNSKPRGRKHRRKKRLKLNMNSKEFKEKNRKKNRGGKRQTFVNFFSTTKRRGSQGKNCSLVV